MQDKGIGKACYNAPKIPRLSVSAGFAAFCAGLGQGAYSASAGHYAKHGCPADGFSTLYTQHTVALGEVWFDKLLKYKD